MVEASKADVRRAIRTKRRALTPLQRDSEAAQVAAQALPWLAEATALASYQALADELDTDRLNRRWWAAGRVVWLPRVISPGILAWHPIEDPRQLRLGAYGIREPDPNLVPSTTLPMEAVVIVPGVGFSADGWRLGQGGGFYDRLLANHPGMSIGVAFACQRLLHVPRDDHDQRVRAVLFGG